MQRGTDLMTLSTRKKILYICDFQFNENRKPSGDAPTDNNT